MKKLAVFDIDGTLANISKRIEANMEHLTMPHWHPQFNWDGFFNGYEKDQPIEWTIELLKVFADHPDYEVFILTARSEAVRPQTEHWLSMNHIPYDKLIMRPSDDHRKDEEIKDTLMQPYKSRIHFIIDDRIAIGHHLRDKGYPVLLCDHVDF